MIEVVHMLVPFLEECVMMLYAHVRVADANPTFRSAGWFMD
jgi:hypothetical protein